MSVKNPQTQFQVCRHFYSWRKEEESLDIFKAVLSGSRIVEEILGELFGSDDAMDSLEQKLTTKRISLLCKITRIENPQVIHLELVGPSGGTPITLFIPEKLARWIKPHFFQNGEIGIFNEVVPFIIKEKKGFVIAMDSYSKCIFFYK